FVFVSDHSNSTGSQDCATGDVEDCPNQGPELPRADWPAGVFPANEISPVFSLDQPSVPTGHVGCLPRNGTFGVEVFEDRPPGAVTGGQALAQCKAAGGFAIVNHPHAILPWIEYDWTSEDFDAIEVYNGTIRFDPWDAESLGEWERRVAQGRDIVPIGASDCHRWGTEPPGTLEDAALGWPSLQALVVDGETPLDAIVAGRVRMAEPGTTITFEATSGPRRAVPGERLGAPAQMTASATSETLGRVLQLKRADGDVVAEVPIEGEVSVSFEAAAGDVVYARVWPASGRIDTFTGGIALTNTIRVE
ncbi:MAG: hypothetical protein AAF211_13110, partial [Myxococcota bacterium]